MIGCYNVVKNNIYSNNNNTSIFVIYLFIFIYRNVVTVTCSTFVIKNIICGFINY